jgi:hypothetical protein
MNADEIVKPGYVRVTELIRLYNDFSGIDPQVLEAKRIIGTNVHNAIESDCSDYLDERESGYYESFLQWKKETGFKTVIKEKRYYYDTWMVTGKIDALGTFPGSEKLTLIDYKTSATINKPAWNLQAHFYRKLVENVLSNDVEDRILFVTLRQNQRAKVVEFLYNRISLALCESLVALHNYFK